MRLSKLTIIFFCGAMILVLPYVSAQRRGRAQRREAPPVKLARYRDNNCVVCHAGITEPLALSNHFYQWMGSKHELGGASCERCHGGDPAVKDAAQAHRGVHKPSVPESTIHEKNLPRTCGACHQQISAVFVKSEHYRKLENSEGAPTCATCHQHMATSVIYWPPETAKLCAGCHNNKGGSAPNHLAEPQKAQDVISAFTRADEIVEWTRHLIDANQGRRAQLRQEAEELRLLDQTLKESKLDWHEFNLDSSRKKADAVFFKGYQLKEALWKKLPVN